MVKSISERRGDVFYDVHGILTAHNSTAPHPLFMALVEFIAMEAHDAYMEGVRQGFADGWTSHEEAMSQLKLCTCPNDDEVTADMRTETQQHLTGCPAGL